VTPHPVHCDKDVTQDRSQYSPLWYSTCYWPLLPLHSEPNHLISFLHICLSAHPDHKIPTWIQKYGGRQFWKPC